MPVIYEKGGQPVTLSVCRIKNDFNCLGLIGDETKGDFKVDLIDKMIKDG